MSNGYEKRAKYIMDDGCPTNVFEEVNVAVPVTVGAKADIGDVKLKCMGTCIFERTSDDPPGHPGAKSKFTVSQKLRVDIPIMFNVDAEIGEGHVDFDLDCGNHGNCKCKHHHKDDDDDDRD